MTSVQNRLQPLNGNRFSRLLLLALAFFVVSCSKKVSAPTKSPVVKSETKVDSSSFEDKTKTAAMKRKSNPVPVISLLLPFNLNNIDVESVNNKKDLQNSSIALDFYQGFRMGVDSATKAGSKIKLQVFDTRDDASEVRRLAQSPAVVNSNLVIGPVYPSEISVISPITKENEQFFVSPLSPKVTISNNPFLIMPNSPLDVHAKREAEFIIEKFEAKRIVLIKDSAGFDSKFVDSFKKEVDELSVGVGVSEFRIGSNNFSGIRSVLVKGANNILVIASSNKSFWLDLIKFVNANSSNYQFTLFAYPGFDKLATSIGLSTVEKANVYFTSSFHVDKHDPANVGFFEKYKSIYAADANEYAIKGFDIGFYFARLLGTNKNNFAQNVGKFYSGVHNNFQFVKTPNGYLNQSLKILKVQNGHITEQR
ncbi:ABC transporter substrate-binding protein [Solitalea koreensis]|uniref:ABC-type branched-chain amino acid transport system, substrate-binding protein n=1 Tax=Solitalea koreensis TaxID=543615 RepID=A0A521D1K6_9SPHI|nr:ABC transporter substrate-binding protein [Solitalea koreensis]SMO65558.1 ABC-type branched-chain amino acid transport system, substrate-binding protein [Solitalea koreensis]